MRKKNTLIFLIVTILLFSWFGGFLNFISLRLSGKLKSPQNILIGILTAPRPVDYLNETFTRIIKEIHSIPTEIATFQVLVANPRPNEHQFFLDLKKQNYKSNFPITFKDIFSRKAPLNESFEGKWRPVSPGNIQLSNDLHEYLTVAQSYCQDWMLLMEDDFLWCPDFWTHFVRVMRSIQDGLRTRRLKSLPSMIRISYGLNGVLIPCSDLPRTIQFIEDHKREGPIDSLLGEFWTKTVPDGQHYFSDRLPLVYRYNLMKHIGIMSTRNLIRTYSYPGCYDILLTTSLMEGENFDYQTCSQKSFSPCAWIGSEENILQELEILNKLYILKNLLKLGKRGEGCDETCEGKCAEWLFPLINDCKILFEMTNCEGICRVDGFILEMPVGPSKLENICSISSLTPLTCEAKRENVERLCPCI